MESSTKRTSIEQIGGQTFESTQVDFAIRCREFTRPVTQPVPPTRRLRSPNLARNPPAPKAFGDSNHQPSTINKDSAMQSAFRNPQSAKPSRSPPGIHPRL